MMQRDLEAARKAWIKAAKSDQENVEREKTDFLAYVNHAGLKRAGARYVDACLELRTLAVVIVDEGHSYPRFCGASHTMTATEQRLRLSFFQDAHRRNQCSGSRCCRARAGRISDAQRGPGQRKEKGSIHCHVN